MSKKLKYYDLFSFLKVGFMVFILGLSFFGTLYYKKTSERDNYNRTVSQFTQSSVSEVINKIDRGENFLSVYRGIFMSGLSKLCKETRG